MSNVEAAIEYLQFLRKHGRGKEIVHVVMVEEEQQKRVKNKSVAISLMIRAWREGLSDVVLDKIMAELDAVESGAR